MAGLDDSDILSKGDENSSISVSDDTRISDMTSQPFMEPRPFIAINHDHFQLSWQAQELNSMT